MGMGQAAARRQVLEDLRQVDSTVSHNLNGQRLGRKGRDTRERILAAAVALIEEADAETVTLSAIARRAGLGMTSLYNYFTDLTELLLAVLEPVTAAAEDAFVAHLRQPWPDETLGEHCAEFVRAFHAYWSRHTGLLHLRNSMADQFDARMLLQRIEGSRPIIGLLGRQMDGPEPDEAVLAMASVLMTGLERAITLATDRRLPRLAGMPFGNGGRTLEALTRVLELAIRDCRART